MSKTKRVRIAVAVDKFRRSMACVVPDSFGKPEVRRRMGLHEDYVITFAYVDAMLTEEPATVRGEVVDG
jgi:hypothetical protein